MSPGRPRLIASVALIGEARTPVWLLGWLRARLVFAKGEAGGGRGRQRRREGERRDIAGGCGSRGTRITFKTRERVIHACLRVFRLSRAVIPLAGDIAIYTRCRTPRRSRGRMTNCWGKYGRYYQWPEPNSPPLNPPAKQGALRN